MVIKLEKRDENVYNVYKPCCKVNSGLYCPTFLGFNNLVLVFSGGLRGRANGAIPQDEKIKKKKGQNKL